VWHDIFICVTWLIHMCDMTHSYVWHDSFTCVPCLIHMCDMTHSYMRHDNHSDVWHDSFTCVTWQSFTCVTWRVCILTSLRHHSNASCKRFMCVTWLIHMCDMTHAYLPFFATPTYVCDTYVRTNIRARYVYTYIYKSARDTSIRMLHTFPFPRHHLIYAIRLTHMCDMTHSYVCHDVFMCVTHHLMCAIRLTHMCDMTHSYVCHDVFMRVTWRIHMCGMTHAYLPFFTTPTHVRDSCVQYVRACAIRIYVYI